MGQRVSGLTDQQAAHARAVILRDVKNMMAHQSEIHYSQGPNRWEGIAERCTHMHNTFPKHCDCSSTTSWMLWDALAHSYHVHDIVNGANWAAGYTGTQYSHGKQVKHDSNLKVGDLIFYGTQAGGVPEHVAIYVGGGMVFSHGGEAGPFILRLDYRSDRRQSRRYI